MTDFSVTTPIVRNATAELSYYDLRAMASLITAVDRAASIAWMVGDTTVVGHLKTIAMRRNGETVVKLDERPNASDDIVTDGWVHMTVRENNTGPQMAMVRSVSDLLYSLQKGSFVIDPNLDHLA